MDSGDAPWYRQEKRTTSEGAAAAKASAAVPTVSLAKDIPAHLLFEEFSPFMMTSTKKKTKAKRPKEKKVGGAKAGWMLNFVAEAGASAEARGVSDVSLANIQGFAEAAQRSSSQQGQEQRQPEAPQHAPQHADGDVPMAEVAEVAEDDDDDVRVPGHQRRPIADRRARRILGVAGDDCEE